jgi:hypothetical protein
LCYCSQSLPPCNCSPRLMKLPGPFGALSVQKKKREKNDFTASDLYVRGDTCPDHTQFTYSPVRFSLQISMIPFLLGLAHGCGGCTRFDDQAG